MRSCCFTKHVATEPEFPSVLKLTAPKLKCSTAFKNVDVRNVLVSFCKHPQMPKRKKGKGWDTDPYDSPRADNLYQPRRPIWVLGCHLYHICKKTVLITKYVIKNYNVNHIAANCWFRTKCIIIKTAFSLINPLLQLLTCWIQSDVLDENINPDVTRIQHRP